MLRVNLSQIVCHLFHKLLRIYGRSPDVLIDLAIIFMCILQIRRFIMRVLLILVMIMSFSLFLLHALHMLLRQELYMLHHLIG